eukprot:m.381721 g.381721  ORF g.381721 m.381721 type:complete len:81 (+) comp16716_c1_seq26:2131-2373(+)
MNVLHVSTQRAFAHLLVTHITLYTFSGSILVFSHGCLQPTYVGILCILLLIYAVVPASYLFHGSSPCLDVYKLSFPQPSI